MHEPDVSSPLDFHKLEDALQWESTAMARPFRLEAFDCFAEQLARSGIKSSDTGNTGLTHVLELGAGPGFLVEHLASRIDSLCFTLLDYSEAMQQLARKRLEPYIERMKFLTRDFKQTNWPHGISPVDCILCNQALHELRHKRHVPLFHRQVHSLLPPGGLYLVCDHVLDADGMTNEKLYMTATEQLTALKEAGFAADVVFRKGSLQLLRANAI